MKKFTSLLLAAAGLFALSNAANAAFVITLTQSGGNVTANGSGTLNLAALTPSGSSNTHSYISSINGEIALGPTTNTAGNVYTGYTGPTSFGSGFSTTASTGSGSAIQMDAIEGLLWVPSGYVSGAALSDAATWNSQTLSSLSVTPGTYTWSWGTGPTADTFVLNASVVPEPGSLGLIGVAATGLLLRRRRAISRA